MCRNPLGRCRARPQAPRAAGRDRARPRSRSLTACRTARSPAPSEIGLAVGPALKRYRMRKHFQIQITEPRFTYTRKTEQINDRGRAGRLLHPAHQPHRERAAPPAMSCAPTRTSNRPSERSGHSKAPNCRSARSTTTSRTASARTSSSACSPTTSPGTSSTHGSPCSSPTKHPPTSPDPVAKAARSTRRAAQGTDQAHHHRRTLPQLQEPARRARDPHPQHDPPAASTDATFEKLTQPTALQAHALDLAEHAPVTT